MGEPLPNSTQSLTAHSPTLGPSSLQQREFHASQPDDIALGTQPTKRYPTHFTLPQGNPA